MQNNTWVTVVSGLPRSGTSMMMQMLHAGGIPALTDAVRGADEDNPRGYYEFEAVKTTKKDASWVAGALGKVVKMVHLLLQDLPPTQAYRVVMMRRDIGEVLASQKKMLVRNGKAGGAIDDKVLAGLYQQQMTKILDWAGKQPNFRVLQVQYADVIRDPAAVAGQLQAFLGDGLDVKSMVSAVDPTLHRNRG